MVGENSSPWLGSNDVHKGVLSDVHNKSAIHTYLYLEGQAEQNMYSV